MNSSPFFSVNQDCDEAVLWTKEKLLQAGLRPVQTFDLHTTRSGLHDCSCPNHGTEACDCQMVVLLIYGKAEEPVTLILHSSEGKTWLSIVDNSVKKADQSIQLSIKQALQENLSR